jgi:hypothetical protein
MTAQHPSGKAAIQFKQKVSAVSLDVVTAGAAIPHHRHGGGRGGAGGRRNTAGGCAGRERGFASWSSGWEQRPQVLGVVFRNR